MSPAEEKVAIRVEGREMTLSNLDKALYPDGFTKGDVLQYYARVAPAMLAHLRRRPVTTKRFPNGTTEKGFIEKNVPRHAPPWVKTVTLPRKGTSWGGKKDSGADTTQFVVADDLATLTWLANLAAIEFHTPMWRIGREGTPRPPDLVVFDLDPGEPATITECCQVAIELRERAAEDGIELVAKTSGSKGLQCYGKIAARRWPAGRSNEYAHSLAEDIEKRVSGVVSNMAKALRHNKVLIDWSQNNPAKTTVTAYSLRALARPSVSTPVTWDEVVQAAEGRLDLLSFSPDQVLERVESLGDLFASLG